MRLDLLKSRGCFKERRVGFRPVPTVLQKHDHEGSSRTASALRYIAVQRWSLLRFIRVWSWAKSRKFCPGPKVGGSDGSEYFWLRTKLVWTAPYSRIFKTVRLNPERLADRGMDGRAERNTLGNTVEILQRYCRDFANSTPGCVKIPSAHQ